MLLFVVRALQISFFIIALYALLGWTILLSYDVSVFTFWYKIKYYLINTNSALFIFFTSSFLLLKVLYGYLIEKRYTFNKYLNMLAILLPILSLLAFLVVTFNSLHEEIRFVINRGSPTLPPNVDYISEKYSKRPPMRIIANEFGFRDVSWKKRRKEIIKTPHWRIVLLGDSVVFGAGIYDQKDILARVLERKLNSENFSNKPFYVFNLSQIGLNTQMEALMLKNWIKEIKPDLVIMYHNQENDLMPKFPYYSNMFLFSVFPLSPIGYFNALDRYPKFFSKTPGVLEVQSKSIALIHSVVKRNKSKIIVNYLHKHCPLNFHHVPQNSHGEMSFSYLGDWDEEIGLTFRNDFHPTKKGVNWMAQKTYSQLKKTIINNEINISVIRKIFDDECVANDKFYTK